MSARSQSQTEELGKSILRELSETRPLALDALAKQLSKTQKFNWQSLQALFEALAETLSPSEVLEFLSEQTKTPGFIKIISPNSLPLLKLKELITGDSPEPALKLCMLLLRHNDSVLVEHITEGDARARDLILKFQTKTLYNAIDHLYRGFTEMRQHSCLKCCPSAAKQKQAEATFAVKEGQWLQKVEQRLGELESALAAQNDKQIEALLQTS